MRPHPGAPPCCAHNCPALHVGPAARAREPDADGRGPKSAFAVEHGMQSRPEGDRSALLTARAQMPPSARMLAPPSGCRPPLCISRRHPPYPLMLAPLQYQRPPLCISRRHPPCPLMLAPPCPPQTAGGAAAPHRERSRAAAERAPLPCRAHTAPTIAHRAARSAARHARA